MVRCVWPVLVVAALGATAAYAGRARTSITVWAAPAPAATANNPFGGVTYGGYAPTSGALVSEQREIDATATPSEVRVAGVAATLDPASVQLRDLTDPSGTTLGAQRFVPGATTPDEILAHHIGDHVAITTTKGEVDGVLRAVDAQTLVVEVGTGDAHHLQVLRRDGFVQDVRLPAGSSLEKPSLAWRLAAKKPGKHTVEITYRAEQISWTADYTAVLDEAQKAIDFSAWATIKNATGATFDDADVTLVSGGGSLPASPFPGAAVISRPNAAPIRFPLATPVRLGNGESVQVELVPRRVAAKTRSVVTFEAMPDPSPSFQTYPGQECSQWNASGPQIARAEVAVELDVPGTTLPDGRVRVFRRRAEPSGGERLELIDEDTLHGVPGLARVRLAPDADVIGERKAIACNFDEHSRTLHERVEVRVENRGKQAVDVVVREFMWRWPVWHIDTADESTRGVRGGAQTQEYRVSLPPGTKKSITYGVFYSW